MTERILGLLYTPEEESYLPFLKPLVGTAKVYRLAKEFSTIFEVENWAKERGITGILLTQVPLLKKLLNLQMNRANPTLDSYAGSLIQKNGIEYVVLPPLEQLVTVNYGKFLAARYISKLTSLGVGISRWYDVPKFSYTLYEPGNAENTFNNFRKADLLSIDIETTQENLRITCVGYTAVYFTDNGISTSTYVIPLKDEFSLAWIRKFNWEIKCPKVFQNGKYDNAYLARFNAPVYNYLLDTANMFHCWYSELPKDLSSLNAFFVRTAMYWKDLAHTGNLEDYYLYNGKDTWATALVAVFWLLEAPDWAKENYKMEFPVVFPSHYCELLGIKRDMKALLEARKEADGRVAAKLQSLRKMLGAPLFNPASSKQVLRLLHVLGHKDITSSGEAQIKKAIFKHPLSARILNPVIELRKDKKLISTYLRLDTDADKKGEGGGKEYKGRILYSLNPHGTDTGRNTSKEGQFWTGFNIQNITRGDSVKRTIAADEGWLFCECDLRQAESRDTAYISGCESLISAFKGIHDFHSVNASRFFGTDYSLLYDDATEKVLNKPLRDLAKRVNHGATYNMGDAVLVETMGLDKVEEARQLLKLSGTWNFIQIAEHLLSQFHKTYVEIKKIYYPWVIEQVEVFKKLVGATGWTRYCFGNPRKNKRDLNAYVAHPPQSLNAMVLNKAFVCCFVDLQMHPIHSNNFRLCAQIHDSILFQYRIGHEYLCKEVASRMEIPITVKGADGKVRTFTVPADIKTGPEATHWHLTES